MNLDELKNIWEQAQPPAPQHSEEEIRRMIYQRSHTALSRIHRNVVWEGAATLIFGLLALGFLGGGERQFTAMWIFFVILTALAIPFYWRKYRQLKRVQLSVEDLRSTLRRNTEVMGSYMKYYTLFTAFFLPLLSIGGVLYGYGAAVAEHGRSLLNLEPMEWVVIGGVGVIYMVLSYFFMRWYLHRLYGKNYEEMVACLRELVPSELNS